MELDRRKFLNSVIAISALNLQSGAGYAHETLELAHLDAVRSMKYIGAAYLQLRPSEAGREILLTALQRSVSAAEEKIFSIPSDIRLSAGYGNGIRSLIRDDFAAGRTVSIQGWVLSESECRICALSAL